MRCDLISKLRRAGFRRFNPYWVFKCAVTIPISMLHLQVESFNPYWVFKCAVTFMILSPQFLPIPEFQSLLGFQMRCDIYDVSCDAGAAGFQSLLGFQMRCDVPAAIVLPLLNIVSIPIGFSNAL